MKLLNDYVLIQPEVVKGKSKAGLNVPAETKQLVGIVNGVGPGTLSLFTGVWYSIRGISPGDRVIYKDTKAIPVVEDGVDMLLVPSIDVLAVLDFDE